MSRRLRCEDRHIGPRVGDWSFCHLSCLGLLTGFQGNLTLVAGWRESRISATCKRPDRVLKHPAGTCHRQPWAGPLMTDSQKWSRLAKASSITSKRSRSIGRRHATSRRPPRASAPPAQDKGHSRTRTDPATSMIRLKSKSRLPVGARLPRHARRRSLSERGLGRTPVAFKHLLAPLDRRGFFIFRMEYKS